MKRQGNSNGITTILAVSVLFGLSANDSYGLEIKNSKTNSFKLFSSNKSKSKKKTSSKSKKKVYLFGKPYKKTSKKTTKKTIFPFQTTKKSTKKSPFLINPIFSKKKPVSAKKPPVKILPYPWKPIQPVKPVKPSNKVVMKQLQSIRDRNQRLKAMKLALKRGQISSTQYKYLLAKMQIKPIWPNAKTRNQLEMKRLMAMPGSTTKRNAVMASYRARKISKSQAKMLLATCPPLRRPLTEAQKRALYQKQVYRRLAKLPNDKNKVLAIKYAYHYGRITKSQALSLLSAPGLNILDPTNDLIIAGNEPEVIDDPVNDQIDNGDQIATGNSTLDTILSALFKGISMAGQLTASNQQNSMGAITPGSNQLVDNTQYSHSEEASGVILADSPDDANGSVFDESGSEELSTTPDLIDQNQETEEFIEDNQLPNNDDHSYEENNQPVDNF